MVVEVEEAELEVAEPEGVELPEAEAVVVVDEEGRLLPSAIAYDNHDRIARFQATAEVLYCISGETSRTWKLANVLLPEVGGFTANTIPALQCLETR